MHLKLKVAGWDYKIHWNKSSLGFGCSLKLTPGGCIWPLSLISVKHALHLFTCQAVSLHFRVLYTSHWTERKTCSAGLLKVQNWVAKSPTMSVLCWIREGRRLLRLDQDESFAFLRQQPGDSCSFIYLFIHNWYVKLFNWAHISKTKDCLLSTFDLITLKGLHERLWWRK